MGETLFPRSVITKDVVSWRSHKEADKTRKPEAKWSGKKQAEGQTVRHSKHGKRQERLQLLGTADNPARRWMLTVFILVLMVNEKQVWREETGKVMS